MQDLFQRPINYLRVSITDRCNLRCLYCMPVEGVPLVKHEEILSLEEIEKLVRIGVSLGITKVRLTGGEPLVRKGIVGLVEKLAAIPGLEEVSLTTNGLLLPTMALDLKRAGLSRVNISLDSLRADRYRRITRYGEIDQVLAGIQAALEADLTPVKLNVVVMAGFNDDELEDFARYTYRYPVHVRFIELMPIGESDAPFRDRFIPVEEMKERLLRRGQLEESQVTGNGPAKYYALPGALGTIGFISAISSHFCGRCNRLRLTAEGKLRPCLQDTTEIDIKTSLRQGASPGELAAVFRRAVEGKVEGHTMVQEGWKDQERGMSRIGG